jgi:hypothetical protein
MPGLAVNSAHTRKVGGAEQASPALLQPLWAPLPAGMAHATFLNCPRHCLSRFWHLVVTHTLFLVLGPTSFPLTCYQTDKRVIVTLSTKVSTFSPAATSSLLASINSNADPLDPQPPTSMCQSRVFSGMCGKVVSGWSITGGCNTVNERCSPPELSGDACMSKDSTAGAFVSARTAPNGKGMQAAAIDDAGFTTADINPDTPPPRPHAPKQAQFVGCCVTGRPGKGAYGRTTCKRIRVGQQWKEDGSSANGGGAGGSSGRRRLLTHPVMNPYKQMRNCRCFNIREYVKMDM